MPANGLLHHYTTADGLKGIIENNQLWATSAYFLNDSAEITYGYGVLKEVLDDWLAKNPRPEGSVTLGLARGLYRFFGEDLLNRNMIRPIYLACFCEDDNLLSQWRTYGQSGGYSLGFGVPPNIAFAGQGFKPEPNTYTSKWARVEYDRNEQVKKCIAILNPLLAISDDPDTDRAMATVADHPLVGSSKIFGARKVFSLLISPARSFPRSCRYQSSAISLALERALFLRASPPILAREIAGALPEAAVWTLIDVNLAANK